MDNGTTGIQVAPVPTEDEMSKVQDIFRRAVDAIVNVSKLNEQVQSLQHTIEGMANDLNQLRQRNVWLDESLNAVRTERDKAKADLAEAQLRISDLGRESANAKADLQVALNEVSRLNSELTETRKARDDHAFRELELTETLKLAQDKLAQIKEGFANIFGSEAKTVAGAVTDRMEGSTHITEQPKSEPTFSQGEGFKSSEPEPVKSPYDMPF